MKRWAKPATLIIALFLLTFLVMRCAEADTLFEVAPASAFIGGDHYTGAALLMTERFADKYDIGIVLMSEQHCGCDRGSAPGNLGIHAQRIVSWKRLELGLGAAYWSNQTIAWNSNTTFALSWGLHFGNFTVRHRHYSTGGSSERNGGLDMLTLGYDFD